MHAAAHLGGRGAGDERGDGCCCEAERERGRGAAGIGWQGQLLGRSCTQQHTWAGVVPGTSAATGAAARPSASGRGVDAGGGGLRAGSGCAECGLISSSVSSRKSTHSKLSCIVQRGKRLVRGLLERASLRLRLYSGLPKKFLRTLHLAAIIACVLCMFAHACS